MLRPCPGIRAFSQKRDAPVRMSMDYRALAIKKGEDYYWIWIGSHDDYEDVID